MSSLIPVNAELPAHIRARFADVSANDSLSSGLLGGFPVISYKGKVWALVANGVREVLVNDQGDPRASIEVVLLKANGALSKTYYKDSFAEGSTEQPDCYSDDGVVPNADAKSPQSRTCAACPHNVWGSKISDQGQKGKECADVRRLAVAASDALDQPALLRVPAGSLRELQVYGENLKKRGVPFQALVTKVKFDPDAAHPRMLFSAARWLDEKELDVALDTADSPLVDRIIGTDGHPGADIADQDDILDNPPEHLRTPAQGQATAAKAAPAKAAATRRAKPVDTLPTHEQVVTAMQAKEPEPVAAAAAPKAKPPADQSAAALIADADSALANLLGGMMSDD
jgi:hypothetical protein